ncbi:MAG: YciI family protein [Solirubrobacteraceae bacterium]
MQYAILIYDRPGAYEALSPGEFERVMAEYGPITEDPAVRGGAQLQPVATATTVRVSDGETLTTDGPFAATKEVFGGYYVIEVDDLDQALAFAARIPSARMGGAVEVRPIVDRGAVETRPGG